MSQLKKGDAVVWISHGTTTHGTIVKVLLENCEFKGKHYRASRDEPYYEVESDNGGTAVHKGSALRKR